MELSVPYVQQQDRSDDSFCALGSHVLLLFTLLSSNQSYIDENEKRVRVNPTPRETPPKKRG